MKTKDSNTVIQSKYILLDCCGMKYLNAIIIPVSVSQNPPMKPSLQP